MRAVEQQIILITGATDGLGRAVARELAARGATLLLHGRSEDRGEETLAEIRAHAPNASLTYYRADFDSLAEIRGLAERIRAEHDRLDVLLNNAALGIDPVRRVSRDGLEATFQVDYLAPYMLSHLLEPLLIASAPSRIVNVASAGQAPIRFDDVMLERSYDGIQAYCQAKLAEIMLTFDHAAALSGTGVTVNCVHPAFNMPTKIVINMFTPESAIADGVTSVLRLITDPELDRVTGRYFDQTQEARALDQAYDERARARVRTLAEQLTGVTGAPGADRPNGRCAAAGRGGMIRPIHCQTKEDRMSAENEALARRFFEEFCNGRDEAVADQIIAADYISHGPQAPPAEGPGGVKTRVAVYQDALDGHWDVQEIHSMGDRVVVRWIGTGTHNAELMGVPATGATISVEAITILRIADGQIAEEWTVWDALGLLQQVGAVPVPA